MMNGMPERGEMTGEKSLDRDTAGKKRASQANFDSCNERGARVEKGRAGRVFVPRGGEEDPMRLVSS
jgi:hypothetical protein